MALALETVVTACGALANELKETSEMCEWAVPTDKESWVALDGEDRSCAKDQIKRAKKTLKLYA